MEYINHYDGEVRIRKSVREDVFILKDILRDQDLEEMRLMGIESVENAILFGYETPESTCYTVEFKDKVVAMFGCVPVEGDTAATLWFLSSNEVKNFKKRFLKLVVSYVEEFKKEYTTLFNLIHPSNTMSMKLVSILKAELRWGHVSPKTEEPFILFLI